jgi:hypothetical protein
MRRWVCVGGQWAPIAVAEQRDVRPDWIEHMHMHMHARKWDRQAERARAEHSMVATATAQLS